MKNLTDLMNQVQDMQSRMGEMQEKLAAAIVQGQAGAGMVRVTMNGKGQVSAVTIDPSLLRPDEKEILEDLIVTALGDAKGKADAMMAEQMKSMTGGFSLPPGFKLPF
jgi:nucleoid-associated protein EbfC